jgi:type I restriction enzyme R subunit
MSGLNLDEVIARETQHPDGCTADDDQHLGPNAWRLGDPRDYDRRFCVDLRHLAAFLAATQPEVADSIGINRDGPARLQFLQRLSSEVESRGVIDVLRRGISHLGHKQIDLFYGTPSEGNDAARRLNGLNRYVVTRQLRYSHDETARALDLYLSVNGLPVATAELKNSLTRQTVQNAIHQYKTDRDPKEPLFRFGRCAVHLAVDDSNVRMCTELKGKASWFLPFDKGVNDGAGNPPNPNGVKTDYLWRETLRPDSFADIIENYAQIVRERDRKTGKWKRKQVFPRYHQLHGVRALLAHAEANGTGQRYLVQHSAGSGKSNSIAWLAHQLVGLRREGADAFDTVVVVTDRRNLDDQIRETIKGFTQVSQIVAPVTNGSDELRRFLEEGRKIVITTIQKFPFVVNSIGDRHRGRRFAIIIDEAHSSQSGKNAAALAGALSADGGEEADPEDIVNAALERRMRSRRLPENASYFAFTATPKAKTLELFGTPDGLDEDGQPRRRPFDSYTMKQAIEEGFIKDVLTNYTPIESYYSLLKAVEGDPEFDAKRAQQRLRRFVEGQDHAIRLKAEIMVDHFHQHVHRLIGGQARAMVVTNGIERAIQYFRAIKAVLRDRKSPYDAIVAFSGEKELDGEKLSEAVMNGFPSADIPDEFEDEDKGYRFLICADKFQTGFDQPLLQTMYVDKTLAGVQAVQTLSRLNRAHPKKSSVFVLDFMNDTDAIQAAFAPFYRTTILSGETDPNRLHDLQREIEGSDLFTPEEVELVVSRFLIGVPRNELDPALDRIVARYQELEEDEQVAFKGAAKDYVRTYEFLAAVLPYTNEEWERLSILLTLLVPKLPTPQSDDLTAGILETIDLESYRVEKQEQVSIRLQDTDGHIEPLPGGGLGGRPEPEMEPLSLIIRTFNERWGTTFSDADRVFRHIENEISPAVLGVDALRNALKNTPANAADVLLHTLRKAVADDLRNGTELYQAYTENEGFRHWLFDHMMKKAASQHATV